MRNFTFGILFLLITIGARAQNCPTSNGMLAFGYADPAGANCYMYVINAIPNSTVYIYSSLNGQLGTAAADGAGQAFVPYTCSQGPVTSVLSVVLSTGEYCDQATIAQPAVLPVKWSSFNTKVVSGGVSLNWSTSYEFNNEKYYIEKSSDGSNYHVLGEVDASNIHGVENRSYSFLDATYSTGSVAYYRIRQVDIDKQFSYSKVVYVNTSKSAGPVKIFPNPFVNEIQLSGISSADLNKGNVRLFTISGVRVNYEISGTNAIRIDNAPAGVYILTVNDRSYKLLKN